MQSQTISDGSESDVWAQVAPLLDGALGCLKEGEHNAIVLRFLEGLKIKQVGEAMGTKEDATRMQINRALEKLRKYFTRRGITLSVAMIATAVSANSVQAAPLGLAGTVTASVVKGTAVSATLAALTQATMKSMLWGNLKFTVSLAVAALLAGGLLVVGLPAASPGQMAGRPDQGPSILIVPAAGVGQVMKGMTTDEVEAVLGKPEKKQGLTLIYYQRLGMSVSANKSGVVAVFCGGSSLRDPGVKTFRGHTKEGIGMRSSRAEVINALGQPTAVEPWSVGQEKLEYRNLGLTFILDTGMVVNMLVEF